MPSTRHKSKLRNNFQEKPHRKVLISTLTDRGVEPRSSCSIFEIATTRPTRQPLNYNILSMLSEGNWDCLPPRRAPHRSFLPPCTRILGTYLLLNIANCEVIDSSKCRNLVTEKGFDIQSAPDALFWCYKFYLYSAQNTRS